MVATLSFPSQIESNMRDTIHHCPTRCPSSRAQGGHWRHLLADPRPAADTTKLLRTLGAQNTLGDISCLQLRALPICRHLWTLPSESEICRDVKNLLILEHLSHIRLTLLPRVNCKLQILFHYDRPCQIYTLHRLHQVWRSREQPHLMGTNHEQLVTSYAALHAVLEPAVQSSYGH